MTAESIFSIDVEDWFNISATGKEPDPAIWDTMPSRVERNFYAMLDLCSEHNVTSTCFFLGYFAHRFPEMVREAQKRGHEIASHGYFHKLAFTQTPEQFYEDVSRAKKTLEDIAGRAVHGYRAPAFSVTPKNLWFFDELVRAKYTYDSSVFPGPHQIGGLPDSPLGPHIRNTSGGDILEFPVTAVPVFGKPMCFFGGGYLRLFPYPVISRMAKRALGEGRPVIYYVHPREIDIAQPRLPLSRKRAFTTYVNLHTTREKMIRLFKEHAVTSFERYIENHKEWREAA